MSFTQRVVSGSSADGEYVYYNATVVNNTVLTTQTTEDPGVYFQDTRQYPLIKDTSQYVVSVDNFSLNGATKTLPIFIPQINPGTVSGVIDAAVANTTTAGQRATQVTYYFASTPTVQGTWAGLVAGQTVTITGFTNTAYNVANAVVLSATLTTFTIASPSASILSGVSVVVSASASFKDPTDINKTIYTVSFGLTMDVGTVPHQFLATVPITWIPENQTSYTVVPRTAVPQQEATNYYFTYSYQHWLDLMNNALTTAGRDVM